MIPSRDVRIAEHVIDRGGAVAILLEGRQRDQRGRRTDPTDYRLFLIGGLLRVMHHGCFVIDKMHQTLTQDLSIDDQFRLGIRRWTAGRDEPDVLTVGAFYDVSGNLKRYLEYGKKGTTPNSKEPISDGERDRRHEVIRHFCDALMDVFDFAWTSSTYAIDATGLWSWGRGRPSDAGDDPTGTGEEPASTTQDLSRTEGDDPLARSA